MNPTLINVILQNLPGIVAFTKAQFAAANPGVPAPTSEDVIAAYREAVTTSLATDAIWLAEHPPVPTSGTSSSNEN